MTDNRINNKPPTAPRGHRPFFLFIIGLILIFSYQNSLTSPFIFDDFGNIVGNKYLSITSLTLPEIKGIFSPNQACKNRKIANLSFAVNYYFGQLNPIGYHCVNILIHIINAWLIFYLFLWYFRRIPPPSRWNPVILSGLTALWWATNPIQTNAVTYIVQRMTSLSTMFCLISLLLYLKAKSRQEIREADSSVYKITIYYLAATVSWIFAMQSKEIAAIFPALILVHELYFFDLYNHFKAKQKQYTIIFFLIFCLLIFEILFFIGPSFLQKILKGYDHRNFTLPERLLTEPRVVFHYISIFLYPLPSRLRLYYDTYPISHTLWSPPATSLALVGVLGWISSIIFFFKKNKLLSFGLLWVLLFLLIESTIIALELVFEHRFYMPSIGFVLALTAIIVWLSKHITIRPLFFYACIGIIVCSQAVGTYTRNRDWNDEITFSLDEVQKNPNSVRALTNLGLFLIKKGSPTQAEEPLQKALATDPDNIIALNDLYVIYDNPPYHNPIVAEPYLQKIIETVRIGAAIPNDTGTLVGLSHHLFELKRYKDCLILLKQVSKYYGAPETFLHIGQCNLQLGHFKDAITALEYALHLEPHNSEIKYYCALSYHEINKIDKAKELLSDLPLDDVQDKHLKQNIQSLLNRL